MDGELTMRKFVDLLTAVFPSGKDPRRGRSFSQGLGVFDLTVMRWSDRYDAHAEPYETPAVVKAWYAANGPSAGTWDSPAVQRLFSQSRDAGTSSSSPQESDGQPGSSPAGAIVGGVVGSVAALCLVAGLVWWFRRRKRKARDDEIGDSKPEQQAHLDNLKPELSAEEKAYLPEIQDNYRSYKIDSTNAVEMDNTHTVEMAEAPPAVEMYSGSPHFAEIDPQRESFLQTHH
ncbi:MAG: hypothetical protein Q9168_004776 [Polycauliona sp. 1 TL-2023]